MTVLSKVIPRTFYLGSRKDSQGSHIDWKMKMVMEKSWKSPGT